MENEHLRHRQTTRAPQLLLGALLWLVWIASARAQTLEAGFVQPPLAAKPLVYWHWINGNVTRAGIQADLEDMQRVGIGGVLLIDVSMYTPQGSAHYGSDEWYGDVQFAIETAHRLGLRFGIANGPGWSGSGGPWITPELSMKRLVWSETEVTGGAQLKVKLPQPSAKLGFYRDVTVLAIPSDATIGDTSELTRDSPSTFVLKAPTPVERRTLLLRCSSATPSGSFTGEIESADPDGQFRPLRAFNLHGALQDTALSLSFPATTSISFRVTLTHACEGANQPGLVSAALTNRARIENVGSKSVAGTVSPVLSQTQPAEAKGLPLALLIPMAPDGSVDWQAPPGQWTLLRFGYTTTGSSVNPAQPDAQGLEIDKLDPAAADFFFEHSLGRILRDAGPLVGTTFDSILFDSWESGQQNWTADFAAQFEQRRGYSLLPMLPVLAGHVLVSRQQSEAFLRDFRRTISELIAKNYYAHMRLLAHQHGLQTYVEAYDGVAFNEAEAAAEGDVMMSEFWAPGNFGDQIRVKRVASVAHTLGKPLVAAEAFTGTPAQGRWLWTPATLKPVGDLAFANGMNQAVLHSYVHQPRSDTMPGFTLGRYGTHFGRLVTWWKQATPWISYLSRSQFLLQQGAPVSDVLVLRTDEIDALRSVPYPSLPVGYSFDWIGQAQLLTATPGEHGLRVANVNYKVLLLPDLWTADLPMLQQIRRFVEAGIPVLGSRPVAASSARDLQQLDRWNALVDQLWNSAAVRAPDTLAATLRAQISPDIAFDLPDATAIPAWIHRSSPQGEIYFLSNPTEKELSFHASFRSGPRQPELWDAVAGSHGNATPFERTADGIRLPLRLAPGGSIFVIFRQPIPARWLTAVFTQHAANPAAGNIILTQSGSYTFTWNDGATTTEAVTLPPPVPLNGVWRLALAPPIGKTFERTISALHDLALDPDPQLKYFAGTITYRRQMNLTPHQLAGNTCILSLGRVQDIATVRVNGHQTAILWTAPFDSDISSFVKAGDNLIEIDVVNRWVNRLIGDEFLPEDTTYKTDGTDFNRGRLAQLPAWYGNDALTARRERTTFTSWKHYTRDSPLVPSGLIGPVSVRFTRSIPVPKL